MFQITKKQHELVKSLKVSSKSIPASTLNCVLGDLDNFHVQPYKLFIKEEQKNLHEHWLVMLRATSVKFLLYATVYFVYHYCFAY